MVKEIYLCYFMVKYLRKEVFFIVFCLGCGGGIVFNVFVNVVD